MNKLKEYLSLRSKLDTDYRSSLIDDETYKISINKLAEDYPEYFCKTNSDLEKMKGEIYSMCANDECDIEEREKCLKHMRDDFYEYTMTQENLQLGREGYREEKTRIYKEYADGKITLGEREAKLALAREKFIVLGGR